MVVPPTKTENRMNSAKLRPAPKSASKTGLLSDLISKRKASPPQEAQMKAKIPASIPKPERKASPKYSFKEG